MRFLGYTLADESVPMPEPSPELFAEMGRFVEEATKAGVVVATGGIAPTAMGASAPAPGARTHCPTVKTKKNVPISSTMSLRSIRRCLSD